MNLPKRLLELPRSLQFLRSYIVEPSYHHQLCKTSTKVSLAYNSSESQSLPVGTFRRDFSSEHLSEVKRFSDRRDKLPSPKDDPDVFGTLAIGKLSLKDDVSMAASKELRELASEVESIYTPEEADDITFKPDHPWSMNRLRRKVFEMLREKKLKLALDTFFEALQDGGFQMNQKDISYICGALMCACARSGNVEMAFLLFDKMKQRGATMKEAWYTSLLNACANSPWDSEQNLLRIEKLRSHMCYKGFEPNQTHFHAMIKAYGRCGATQAAFAIVDEIRDRIQESHDSGLRITAETFNFLLQACISDKQDGYRHAVLTWKRMLKMKVKPDVYSYKLFLRAIRECSIQLPKKRKTDKGTPLIGDGDSQNVTKPVQRGLQEVIQPVLGSLRENMAVVEILNTDEEDSLRISGKETFPLVGKSNAELQLLLNVPENRFALLGGIRAFTIQMQIHKVRLDVTIATELVQNVSAEEIPDVLMALESAQRKPDIHFLNMALKKYIVWKQDDNAKKILKLFANYNLTPNIMTFGVLALGARNWSDCSRLFREMDSLGVIPNDEIFGACILQACKAYDPRYIIRLLEEHVRREIKPSQYFVRKIINFQEYVHKAIVDVECGREVRPDRLNQIVRTSEFTEYWEKLNLRFEDWVREVGVKEEEIPWKKDTEERLERLKKRKLQPEIYRE